MDFNRYWFDLATRRVGRGRTFPGFLWIPGNMSTFTKVPDNTIRRRLTSYPWDRMENSAGTTTSPTGRHKQSKSHEPSAVMAQKQLLVVRYNPS